MAGPRGPRDAAGSDDALARLIEDARRQVSARPDCWLFGISRGAERGRALFDAGYDFVAPTADVWLLADAARAVVASMRG